MPKVKVRGSLTRESEPIAEEKDAPRYFVTLEAAGDTGRSMSMLIADRRCYACQQSDTLLEAASRVPQELVQQIFDHCSHSADYLLPDTPVKEAIFRVLLAGGNEPMTAEEVGQALSERWAMSVYPRDLSAGVIQRLLDNSQPYGVVKAPETATKAA